MISKVILLCLMIVSTLSVKAQVNLSTNIEDEFIGNVIQLAMKSNLQTVNGRYVVAKQKFCQENDCDNVFKDYKGKLYFYSTEDMFMRNIKDFIIIESYNSKKDSGLFGIMRNDKYEVVKN